MNDAQVADAFLAVARLVEIATETGRREHLAVLTRDQLADVAIVAAQTLHTQATATGMPPLLLVEWLRFRGQRIAAGDTCRCCDCEAGLRL